MTIVLILLLDVVFRDAFDTLTTWSLLGSGMIVCAFAVLAYENFNGNMNRCTVYFESTPVNF